MPIRPENRSRYPRDWRQIRERIRARANDRCEQCGVLNGVFRNNTTGEVTTNPMQFETWVLVDGDSAAKIVCTTAHLDHTPENCADENLKFLCQRCHLRYDAEHHAQTAYMTRRAGKAMEMFPVSMELQGGRR